MTINPAKLRALQELAISRKLRLPQLEQLWARRAREAGATWQDIADTVGMARRSAWERYGRKEGTG